MRKNLWKLKRSELTPDELKHIRFYHSERKKKWEKLNPEKNRIYRSRYYQKVKKKPVYITQNRLRARIHVAITKAKVRKKDSILSLCGCSTPELMLHLQSQFKEGMHWNNYGKWHIDHIRPCASFDLTDPEQQRQCFHYSNLQPLWAKENLSKGARLITT